MTLHQALRRPDLGRCGRRLQGVGDFDADGRADILWRDATGALAIWFQGSKASAVYPQYVPGAHVGLDWEIQGVPDFDADGRSDILWRHSGGQVAIWLMEGGQNAGDAYVSSGTAAWRYPTAFSGLTWLMGVLSCTIRIDSILAFVRL